MVDRLSVLAACRQIQAEHPHLREKYSRARKIVRAFKAPAFYEVTTKCNLKCEGCYYFEGGKTASIRARDRIDDWKRFFADEAARGVSMAYFVGAEPAMAPDRLMAAAEHFPYGNIGTNGTIRIDSSVQYRIGVSVWAGDDEADTRLRGGSVFRKALRNYAGDPRAIILLTVSKWAVDQIPRVAELCQDHDLPLTFNIYSPTHQFNRKLSASAPNDSSYFRISSPDSSPKLDDAALKRLRRAMNQAIEDYPDTVIYSKSYNDYICQPGSRYELDPDTGIAIDCQSRIREPMRYFDVSLSPNPVKCCTPDVDCRTCRMYSGGWSSRFIPKPRDAASPEAFEGWLDSIETLGRIFLYSPVKASAEKTVA